MLLGIYQGFTQYYRFAAADSVPDYAKSKAISWVIGGGIVAAFAGPNLARFTQDLGAVPYAYSYLSTILLSIAALGVVAFLRLDKNIILKTNKSTSSGRSLKEIIKDKNTVLALFSSSTAFAVMGMSMTATPIAMHDFGHSSSDTAMVIQWHVLGMFLPSFFYRCSYSEIWCTSHHSHRSIDSVCILNCCAFRDPFYQFYNRIIYCWTRLEFLVYRRVFSTYKSLQT